MQPTDGRSEVWPWYQSSLVSPSLRCISTRWQDDAMTELRNSPLQNGALVNVYTDGSVLLAHGGTEMGQGLHTKMIQVRGLRREMVTLCQVASHTLGIDHSKVHILETGTDTVPNTPPTAASAGSDLNGMAVLEACRTINQRLHKYKVTSFYSTEILLLLALYPLLHLQEAKPEGSWESWVTAAFFDRVSLSTTGFHATPDIGYDFK